jgi:hypothetical protein
VCSAAASPPEGFRTCVAQKGDIACDSYSVYSERHVFYSGVDDTRTCTPCTCGAPTGGTCSMLITLYTDAACSIELGSDTVKSTDSAPCLDMPVGSGLGSEGAPLTTGSSRWLRFATGSRSSG